MLENLRDKILNVQHDLSASFRNLASGDVQSVRNKKHNNYKNISLNAGADLLHHYQQLWKELHDNDARNAKKAEEVDALLGNLHSYCFDHLTMVRQLNTQFAALPQLQTSILDLMGKIGELEGVFEEVEDALMNLEDVIEIQELQERQLDHRFQLAMYKEKKLADFEDMKVKLGKEHAHKLFEHEKKQDAYLRERQNTFQEAFEEEIQQYKVHGELRKRISSTSSAEASISLEDIDLGEDATVLDDFFDDENNEEEEIPHAANDGIIIEDETNSNINEIPQVNELRDRPPNTD